MSAHTSDSNDPSARPYESWPTLYADVPRGEAITNTGSRITFRPGARLAEFLDRVPRGARRVYLCGALPTDFLHGTQLSGYGTASPFRHWCGALIPPDSQWQPDQRGHNLKDSDDTAVVLRFRHCITHDNLEIRTISIWLSEQETASVEDARTTLAFLGEHLARAFPGAVPLGTPSMTGLVCWGIARRKSGIEYPRLQAHIRDILYEHGGLGRIELLDPFPPRTRDEPIPGLYCLDGRFMYASPALAPLGIGPAFYDEDNPDFEEDDRPGFYEIEYTVPKSPTPWSHVGLLMTKAGPHAHDGWRYPAEPGFHATTWADGLEIAVALWPFPHACPTCRAGRQRRRRGMRCEDHGWHVSIRKRILYKKPSRGPLRTWAEKLIAMRETIAANQDHSPAVVHLAQAAARNVLIFGVAGFHPSPHRLKTHIVGEEEIWRYRPSKSDSVLLDTGKQQYTFWTPANPTDPDQIKYEQWHKPFDYPEWFAQVVAHIRARMLSRGTDPLTATGALTLPRSEIIGFQIDCLYTAIDPGWDAFDTHKPGQLRTKWFIPYPIPYPHALDDIGRIKREAHV